MAQLNFPDPSSTQTYTEAGITWTWNATLGVWSAEPGSADEALTEIQADSLYLSKKNDDTAAGAITFEGRTTHEDGVFATGGTSIRAIFDTTTPNWGGNQSAKFYASGNSDQIGHQGFTANDIGPGTDGDAVGFYYQENNANSTHNNYGFKANVFTNAGAGENYAFFSEGDAPSYFGGLTEHAGGVQVPGDVDDDKILVSGNIRAAASSNATGISVYTGAGNSVGTFRLYNASYDSSQSGSVTTQCIGYDVATNLKSVAPTNIGFNSRINTEAGKDNYNFYAAGTAPSYLSQIVGLGDGVLTNGITNPIYTQNTHTGVRITSEQIEASRVSSTPQVAVVHLNRIGSDQGQFIRLYNGGTQIDSIRLDGAGGITYGTSDYRVKENIVDLPSAVDQIKSLRPVNFNFTWAPGKTRPGFIAHEVAETIPAAVTGEKDAVNEDGTPELQGVDATKLIPLLTKALQEALERIEILENA